MIDVKLINDTVTYMYGEHISCVNDGRRQHTYDCMLIFHTKIRFIRCVCMCVSKMGAFSFLPLPLFCMLLKRLDIRRRTTTELVLYPQGRTCTRESFDFGRFSVLRNTVTEEGKGSTSKNPEYASGSDR